MPTQVIPNDVQITGNLTVTGNVSGSMDRTNLVTEFTSVWPIELQNVRVWDAFQTALGTAAADDLGITAGTWATGAPYIVSRDLNALGATTGYGRVLFTLPKQYVSGQPVTVRLHAGMLNASASVSSTCDVECYRSDKDATVGGVDLCSTSATAITTTFAAKDFTISPGTLSAGDQLDIRIALILNSVTASSHFGAIAAIEVITTSKG